MSTKLIMKAVISATPSSPVTSLTGITMRGRDLEADFVELFKHGARRKAAHG